MATGVGRFCGAWAVGREAVRQKRAVYEKGFLTIACLELFVRDS